MGWEVVTPVQTILALISSFPEVLISVNTFSILLPSFHPTADPSVDHSYYINVGYALNKIVTEYGVNWILWRLLQDPSDTEYVDVDSSLSDDGSSVAEDDDSSPASSSS